jgi:hypothetical protein
MEARMSTQNLNEDTGQELESTVENEVEIELVDDTPESDRGRKPLDREVVDPTDDELQQYSAGVKKRISELTHARHDERRKAEALAREREELERATRNLLAENQRLKQYVQTGEQEFMKVSSSAAEMELQAAKKQYKEAYESGDSDALLAAQEALTDAKFKLQQAKNFKPAPLQNEEEVVQTQHQVPDRVSVSDDTLRWQQRNQWFNDPEHPEMTAFALGVHKKLVSNGVDPRSKDYFDQIDDRMKKTFPEFFGEAEKSSSGDGSRKPTTVVAPSTRSTGVKKVKLTTTQEALARRLGITPQQYAVELAKMEKQNG